MGDIMTTRELVVSFFSVGDLVELARLCTLAAALVALNAACDRIEGWIDG